MTIIIVFFIGVDDVNSLVTAAMFPSRCFYEHFEASHQKRVMEMAKNKIKKLLIRKKVFYAHLR